MLCGLLFVTCCLKITMPGHDYLLILVDVWLMMLLTAVLTLKPAKKSHEYDVCCCSWLVFECKLMMNTWYHAACLMLIFKWVHNDGCCCWLLVDYHAAYALLLLWNLFVFPAYLHGLCLGYLFDCCCMIIIVSFPWLFDFDWLMNHEVGT